MSGKGWRQHNVNTKNEEGSSLAITPRMKDRKQWYAYLRLPSLLRRASSFFIKTCSLTSWSLPMRLGGQKSHYSTIFYCAHALFQEIVDLLLFKETAFMIEWSPRRVSKGTLIEVTSPALHVDTLRFSWQRLESVDQGLHETNSESNLFIIGLATTLLSCRSTNSMQKRAFFVAFCMIQSLLHLQMQQCRLKSSANAFPVRKWQ